VWGMGVALYHTACLEPPFAEDSMQALFKSILYKNPKPIHTCYSPRLQEFIFKMLEKKKNNRPLVVDIIEYFSQVPPSFGVFTLGQVDQDNFNGFSEHSK